MKTRWLALVALIPFGVLAGGCPEETEEPVDEFPPPPEGQGFQFGTGEQPVGPGEEVQNCYFFKVADLAKSNGLDPEKPVNLHRVQAFQKDGSHHMNLFRVKTIVPHEEGGLDPARGPYLNKNGQGACFKSTNWADWPLIANTQVDGTLDWTFPDGVANRLQPDEWIMLQSHYVNGSTQKTPDGAGEVRVNFWHLAEDEVVHEMGTLFATKQSIRICQSNPNPTFSGSCQIATEGQPVTIIGANGHFHSRGKQFSMFSWDGINGHPGAEAMFYQNEAWDEPLMSHGDALAQIPAGGGVFYDCSFQWQEPPAEIGCAGLDEFDRAVKMTPEDQLDCCYTFGPVVDKNEHCNVFVYYYPASANHNCF